MRSNLKRSLMNCTSAARQGLNSIRTDLRQACSPPLRFRLLREFPLEGSHANQKKEGTRKTSKAYSHSGSTSATSQAGDSPRRAGPFRSPLSRAGGPLLLRPAALPCRRQSGEGTGRALGALPARILLRRSRLHCCAPLGPFVGPGASWRAWLPPRALPSLLNQEEVQSVLKRLTLCVGVIALLC